MQMGKQKKKNFPILSSLAVPYIFQNISPSHLSKYPPPHLSKYPALFLFLPSPQKPPLTNNNHQHRPLRPHRRQRLRPFILVDLATETHARSVCAGRDGTVFRDFGAGSVADEVLSLLAREMGLVKWDLKSKDFVFFCCFF